MGAMSDLDIMRQEGDREISDFEDRGYDRPTAKAMSEIVKRAEPLTRESRLEAAVRTILAIEDFPGWRVERVELTPETLKQLQEALK